MDNLNALFKANRRRNREAGHGGPRPWNYKPKMKLGVRGGYTAPGHKTNAAIPPSFFEAAAAAIAAMFMRKGVR